MSRHSRRLASAILVLGLAAITCNLPAAERQVAPTDTPVLSVDDIANTAAARALTAQAALAPSPSVGEPSIVPSATTVPGAALCNPTVKANTDANVRSGPGTAYDIVGFLPSGGTAPVAGRNDSSTWWYIAFAGGSGGHAWIAASVTTADCIPPVVQVVAAPPLPTAPPATNTPKFALLQPMLILTFAIPADGDIQLQEVFLSTGGEVLVRVAVSPTGSLTGTVTYRVWVDGSLRATNSHGLPTGSELFWSGVVISGTHDVKAKVDTTNAFAETDEGNNEWQGSLSH